MSLAMNPHIVSCIRSLWEIFRMIGNMFVFDDHINITTYSPKCKENGNIERITFCVEEQENWGKSFCSLFSSC